MGMIYKRGNVWWCKYYVNGRPIRESTGTEKETGAKRFLKVREGRVAMGQPILRRADRRLTGAFSGKAAPMAVEGA